jgi:hypothetical protein
MNYETPVYMNDLEVEVLHGVLSAWVAEHGEEFFFSHFLNQLSDILVKGN